MRGIASSLPLLPLLAAGGAGAQAPPAGVPGASAEITVTLVQIEVRVEGKDGEFLAGLAADDFEVREDGEPRPVQYVDEVRARAEPAARPTPAAGAEPYPPVEVEEPRPASVLLVVDGANSDASSVRRQTKRLAEFVGSLRPHVRVALFELRPDGGFEMRSNFTPDRARTIAAIERLKPGAAGEGERRAKQNQIESSLEERLSACGRDVESRMCREAAFEHATNLARLFAEEERSRSLRSIDSLRTILGFAGHLPGSRSLLLVSEGIDPGGATYFNSVAKLIEYYAQSSGVRDTTRWIMDLQNAASPYESELPRFEQLAHAASSGGVTVYWLNPSHSGDISPFSPEEGVGSYTAGADLVNVPRPERLMQGLAEDTGGLALVRAAGVDDFLADVASDIGSYYVVSYTPARDLHDGKEHEVKVTVKRPGARVRTRGRYVDHTGETRERRQLATALDFPEVAGLFPIELRHMFLRAGPATYELIVHVGVPYRELQPAVRAAHVLDRVRFAFVLRDPTGAVRRTEEASVDLQQPEAEFDRLAAADGFLDYRHRFELEPGRYSLTAAVLDARGSRTAARQLDLVLPAERERCLTVTPLMLARGVVPMPDRVRDVAFDERGDARYGDLKLSFGALARLPPSGKLAGLYQVLNPDRGADGYVSVAAYFRLLRGATVVSQTRATSTQDLTGRDAGTITNFFAVPYNNLAPGDYRLELVVRDGKSGCDAVAGADFQIVPESRPAPDGPEAGAAATAAPAGGQGE